MKRLMTMAAAAAALATPAMAGLCGDTPDAKHAWAVHDWNRPKPHKVEPAKEIGQPPSDAVVLFDGTKESFEKNWHDGRGNVSNWKYSPEGYFYCIPEQNRCNIYTREEFGDCQLHVEFRHDESATKCGDPQMRGNSGVFLMNNYEIQVLESYTTSREMEGKEGYMDNYADGMAGAVYAENPPLVNPSRPVGEWQVYDIVFHQPVWDGNRLVHPGSVSVFFNGVLVQDHWEMEGLTTNTRRRPLAPHKLVGPLMLQDHICVVQYRNIWYRPLASRWANTTHSVMSANEGDVMKLRRETAERLFAKIADPAAATAANVKALGEVISYSKDGKFLGAFNRALKAYAEKPGDEAEVRDVNYALDVLIRNGVIEPKCRLPEKRKQ